MCFTNTSWDQCQGDENYEYDEDADDFRSLDLRLTPT